MKIPFISQTYTTAVAISFRQSHARTSNIVKYHTRVVFTESFHAMVCTDEDVCSTCVIDESKLRHVRLDNSTLMPNMGITKWSKNYDVIELTIAIITSSPLTKK